MQNSKNAMTKSDIVNRVYEKVGFTRKEAVDAVEVLFNEIKSKLAEGENVRISGFAGFHLRQKKERIARNPKTGELITIKARRVLTFKPSQQLLESTDRGSDVSEDS